MRKILPVIFVLIAMSCVACGDDDPSTDSGQASDDEADDDAGDDDSADDDAGPTRSFRMAAAPMQYRIEPYHIETVFDFGGFDGRVDAVSLHMDSFFGVPWEEFADDLPPPGAWLNAMNEAKAAVDALGVPVYLALTPLDGNRTGLAPYTDVDEEGRLFTVSDWNDTCYDFATAPDAARYRAA